MGYCSSVRIEYGICISVANFLALYQKSKNFREKVFIKYTTYDLLNLIENEIILIYDENDDLNGELRHFIYNYEKVDDEDEDEDNEDDDLISQLKENFGEHTFLINSQLICSFSRWGYNREGTNTASKNMNLEDIDNMRTFYIDTNELLNKEYEEHLPDEIKDFKIVYIGNLYGG